jgi:hypothetical protein
MSPPLAPSRLSTNDDRVGELLAPGYANQASAANLGEFMGVAPTGREVTVTFMSTDRFAGGNQVLETRRQDRGNRLGLTSAACQLEPHVALAAAHAVDSPRRPARPSSVLTTPVELLHGLSRE